MKNSAAFVYLTIILMALLLFLLFDRNAAYQEAKAGDAIRISRINMLNSECRENIRICAGAMKAKGPAAIRVRALKTFIGFAEKNIEFGNESGLLWKAVLENIRSARLSDSALDRIRVKKEDVEETAEILGGLRDFIDRSIDNGYNFEF